MATGRDLLSTILTDLGVLPEGATIPAVSLVFGLNKLNAMIKSWNIQPLVMYKITRETFTWTGLQASRTMGTGGNFATTRPTKITGASVIINNIEYPIDHLLTAEDWQAIPDKSVQSDIPQKMYIEGTYPLETLNVWPVPTNNITVAIYSETPITALAANDTISLPDGMERAIVTNGALELADSQGKGNAITPTMLKNASESLAAIKIKNSKRRLLKSDAAGMTNTGTKNPYKIYGG